MNGNHACGIVGAYFGGPGGSNLRWCGCVAVGASIEPSKINGPHIENAEAKPDGRRIENTNHVGLTDKGS